MRNILFMIFLLFGFVCQGVRADYTKYTVVKLGAKYKAHRNGDGHGSDFDQTYDCGEGAPAFDMGSSKGPQPLSYVRLPVNNMGPLPIDTTSPVYQSYKANCLMTVYDAAEVDEMIANLRNAVAAYQQTIAQMIDKKYQQISADPQFKSYAEGIVDEVLKSKGISK